MSNGFDDLIAARKQNKQMRGLLTDLAKILVEILEDHVDYIRPETAERARELTTKILQEVDKQ